MPAFPSSISRRLARLTGRHRNGRPVRRVLTKAEKRYWHMHKVRGEMIVWQAWHGLMFPKSTWARIVQEIITGNKDNYRSTMGAKAALAEAAQDYIVKVFQDADLLRKHRKRETLTVDDMRTVRLLWNRHGI